MQLRKIELARAAWGGALLLAPRAVLENFHHVRVDPRSIRITRVLGARQLTQAVLSGLDPSPEVLAMGVWVDTAHAASAVGLAVLDRTRARAGLSDATVAGLWAVAGYRDLSNSRATPPRHDRLRDALARTVLALVPGGEPLLRMSDHDRAGTNR